MLSNQQWHGRIKAKVIFLSAKWQTVNEEPLSLLSKLLNQSLAPPLINNIYESKDFICALRDVLIRIIYHSKPLPDIDVNENLFLCASDLFGSWSKMDFVFIELNWFSKLFDETNCLRIEIFHRIIKDFTRLYLAFTQRRRNFQTRKLEVNKFSIFSPLVDVYRQHSIMTF